MCPMTTTIMAETCNICEGSTRIWVVDKIKTTLKCQNPTVEKSSMTRDQIHSKIKKTHSTQTTGKRNTNLHT